MARGHQKIQSQKKNQEKQAKLNKGKGVDHKASALKALVHSCPVCRAQMGDLKNLKQHFESKHPKSPLPDSIKDI